MNKSVWHKPSETPQNYSAIIEHHKVNDYDNHTPTEQYDIWATGGSPVNPFDEYTIRWAYVEDFLALENELDRTHKALDVALDKLKRIQKIYTNAPFNAPINYANVCTDMYDVATEQITELEQKDE